MPQENLWTGFNGRKLAAERAKKDWNGRDLSTIASANDSTVTITAGSNSTPDGTFTLNQSTNAAITLAAATTSTDGVMSSTDKTKLDGIAEGATKVEEGTNNGDIKVTDASGTSTQMNVYTHATNGADAIKGETADVSPGFGDTFKVLYAEVNQLGHTTVLEDYEVTIPDAVATTTDSGLMSAADKTKLEGIETGAQVNVKPDWNAAAGDAAEILNKPTIPTVNDGTLTITVGSNAAQTFTANQSTNTTIDIPNAASAQSGGSATGGLMTDTDKANLDNATAVIPSDATSNNQLVSTQTLTTMLADFGGYKTATGTGSDNHPDVQNPDTRYIYLVKDTSSTAVDKYKEWICTNTTGPVWDLVGDTTMDMSGYVEMPSTHTDTHIVVFGPNNDIADSGKTVAELENVVTTVSVGSGSTISPTSGTTNINIPVASSSADGAMSSTDKAKLDGITDYVVSATFASNTLTLTPKNGTAVTVDIPSAPASTDTPVMDGTGAVGSSTAYARADHQHPSDTSKLNKVAQYTAGNLPEFDTQGELVDSGYSIGDFLTGVKLDGASDELAPDPDGVVTIPNAVSTGQSGATNGLMTANQSQMLDQIGAWTWSYAPFDDSGAGAEQTSTFPFTVS